VRFGDGTAAPSSQQSRISTGSGRLLARCAGAQGRDVRSMLREDGFGWRRASWTAFACLALSACSSQMSSIIDPRYGVSTSPRVVEYGQPVPKGGGVYKLGPAYTVAGHTYVPEENQQYRAEGVASWYGSDFHGRMTANGEIY